MCSCICVGVVVYGGSCTGEFAVHSLCSALGGNPVRCTGCNRQVIVGFIRSNSSEYMCTMLQMVDIFEGAVSSREHLYKRKTREVASRMQPS